MSTELFMRGLFALLMGGCFCWAVHRNKNVEDTFDPEQNHQRYLPLVSGVILPVFVLGTAAVMLIVRPAGVEQSILSMFFSLFLHISVYYLILLALLPFLRRHFSATACAALWLIPNYLYLTQQSFMELPAPALTLRLPMGTAGVLLAVWATGAAAVMLFKIASHLRFRRQVLRAARPEEDPAVLAVWDAEVAAARFQKPKFRLVRSPAVTSPLSIGLFERSTRVVLPEKEYSPEELALIFRHELVHIGRQDAWSKFFLAFCAAVCWFDPLMWLAMGKSADDLELSCDEAVLQNESDARRRQYADLLLTTAGDGRGFTTCLSPGAKAMRYRLKSVVKPAKKFTGGVLVGAVFFVLCMTSGYVTLAFDAGMGADVLFDGQDPAACTIASAQLERRQPARTALPGRTGLCRFPRRPPAGADHRQLFLHRRPAGDHHHLGHPPGHPLHRVLRKGRQGGALLHREDGGHLVFRARRDGLDPVRSLLRTPARPLSRF